MDQGKHLRKSATVRERIIVLCGDIPHITVYVCVKYSRHILGGAIVHVAATLVALKLLGLLGGEH